MRIVIDEDQPRSLGSFLQEHHHTVKDIRDHGLRGVPDLKIFQFAQETHSTLLTSDFGFSNILHYPPQDHYGILIIHFPNEVATDYANKEVLKALEMFSGENNLKGRLVLLEPGKMRIRTRF